MFANRTPQRKSKTLLRKLAELMPHRIEVFSGNCPLCREIVDELEAGKCAGCELIVHRVSENMSLARRYGVRVVPTIIIDGWGQDRREARHSFCL